MLPRSLLLCFVSVAFAADASVKNADLPLSDLRKLSQEDLVELDEFLSRVQQVLHPKDTMVDKLGAAQAPFARLVAKLGAVPPVHRLSRKIKGDEFSAGEVSAQADSPEDLAQQRQTYSSMRSILDVLFGMEDGVDSDADSDDSDSDDNADSDAELSDADAADDDVDDDAEADGDLSDDDLDDYDWFYRIFGTTKDGKGARAAVDEATPKVGSLELQAQAQRYSNFTETVSTSTPEAAEPTEVPTSEDSAVHVETEEDVPTESSLKDVPAASEESLTEPHGSGSSAEQPESVSSNTPIVDLCGPYGNWSNCNGTTSAGSRRWSVSWAVAAAALFGMISA
ncbi:hypothetical protein A9F13_04g01276 [Clavispora lusitaniae]|uniref:Uncharacterized protein n=1 Tax=Clavispora lusitaniae TaxID=36911 RepID=A0AA91T2Z7_CLALS|nr:hypothetical protein A9F13_04g01276 [Clavispora lusitaniae]